MTDHEKAVKRIAALCKAWGWQGGTVHQLAEVTGVPVAVLQYGKPSATYMNSDYSHGWFSARTNSLAFNLAVQFPKRKGNHDFWIGVAESSLASPN